MAPMLATLDHIVIAVGDLEAATEVQTRLLGRRPSWRGVHPTFGTANTLFRLDNLYVELLAPRGSGGFAVPLAEWIERRGEGLFALAFGTPDVAAAALEFRQNGLSAQEPAEGLGTESTKGTERRWSTVFLPTAETRGITLFAIEHRSAANLLPSAVPVEDEASAISGCDHVVVRTSDPDRSSDLYGRQLGLRLALDKSLPEWGMRLLFFRIGGVTVELAAPLATTERDGEDHLWGVSYRTKDVEAVRRRLVREGFDVSEVRSGRKPGTRVSTVNGEPSGVATLLITHD
jgi:catechol 2,3-dioxygenase-like lactoylglutathione lyase family enzyme